MGPFCNIRDLQKLVIILKINNNHAFDVISTELINKTFKVVSLPQNIMHSFTNVVGM